MPDTITLDVSPGALFRFAGIRGPGGRWSIRPGVYRCLGVASAYRQGQEFVVHVGVGGWDDGNLHLAPLVDWQRNFTRIVEAV